ncbi:MAG: serine/threonine protein kinase [Alphaproteobacteria bacterium]|nr:serine/threonine protein kinase [Alphaproteobacteria bacterium]
MIHATCVALGGGGVLLTGPAGSGKSEIALQLIEGGGVLVSDDQTELSLENGVLTATAPAALAGLIEMRHVGLLRLLTVTSAPVVLYVRLVDFDEPLERLPARLFHAFLGFPVRALSLPGHAASTPTKIRLALSGSFEDV